MGGNKRAKNYGTGIKILEEDENGVGGAIFPREGQ